MLFKGLVQMWGRFPFGQMGTLWKICVITVAIVPVIAVPCICRENEFFMPVTRNWQYWHIFCIPAVSWNMCWQQEVLLTCCTAQGISYRLWNTGCPSCLSTWLWFIQFETSLIQWIILNLRQQVLGQLNTLGDFAVRLAWIMVLIPSDAPYLSSW